MLEEITCINWNIVDEFLTLDKNYIYRPRSLNPCAIR